MTAEALEAHVEQAKAILRVRGALPASSGRSDT